jgi:serine protease AprX
MPDEREQDRYSIPSDLVEYILLGHVDDRRQLQDSPILGDVWLAYAARPEAILDLLISPHRDATAGRVAGEISKRIRQIGRAGKPVAAASIAYLQGIVAARLYFEEVLRILVPLTQWWCERNVRTTLEELNFAELGERVKIMLQPRAFRAARTQPASIQDNFSALERYVALAGLFLWAGDHDAKPEPRVEEVLQAFAPHIDATMRRLSELFRTIKKDHSDKKNEPLIFQISLNRRPVPALDRSVPSVKADAARRLFNVSCNRITWAVLDAGVDTNHEAFKTSDGKSTRIAKTVDFTRVREIVSSDPIADKRLAELLADVSLEKGEARKLLKRLEEDAENERPINWGMVEQFITIDKPAPPKSSHGTHVAGIIGADSKGGGKTSDKSSGVCPDIQLFDLRVLDKTLADTEFAIISALQYIRYLNEQHNHITVHGANLSLSIPHSVRNYACGKTPICNECERLVESGVVVVAAAGNHGYHKFRTEDGTFEGYSAFSITDPGNADGVITVGATHGHAPHTYGVSFFSSRGPTGDGRLKPDLVAPGERIQAPILNNEWGQESGTSMAAPHVSGAAAMLMARYPELVGQPRRIKRILCESATDLARERTFQGAGMLDVLRAFQSI